MFVGYGSLATPYWSTDHSIVRIQSKALDCASWRSASILLIIMIRQTYIPVEPAFDEFVTLFGGEKVSDVISQRPDLKGSPPLNADYLFPIENIIAELKCLEEDTYSASEFNQLMTERIANWQKRGMLSWELYGGPMIIQSRDLPVACQLELEQLVNRRLRKVITKANKQIRLTKETLGLPFAKGLLLLVSDGNYFLRPEHVLGFAGRILRSRFSNINSIVYLTVNSTVAYPQFDKDALPWIQAVRDGFEPVSAEFLSRFRAGWFAYLANKLGMDIPEHVMADDFAIEKMRFIREVDLPDDLGIDSFLRTSASHEFGDVYRIIGPIPKTVGARFRLFTGALVRCREETRTDGTVALVAFEQYSDPKRITLHINKRS